MDFALVINQIIVLFLLLVVGFVVRKLEIINDDFIKNLSNLLLKVTMPALIISSMQLKAFSAELMTTTVILLMISLSVYILSILLAMFVPRLLGIEKNQVGVYQFLLVFANVGFIGYPLVEAILGKEAIFYAAIYNLPFNFLVYTLGYYYMSKGRENQEKFTLRKCLNPGVIAVVIGFILFLSPVKLPYAVNKVITDVGSLTTPLSMIIVGALLINAKLKELFANFKLYLLSGYRMILFPLMVNGLLVMIFKNMNVDPFIIGVPVVISALPVAVNAAILAEKYDNSPDLASNSIFISTLLSMITIPLISYLVF